MAGMQAKDPMKASQASEILGIERHAFGVLAAASQDQVLLSWA